MVTLVLVLTATLTVSFTCSILEATLLSISYSFVEMLREEGHRAGDYLRRFQEKIDEPITAILTLNTISNTAGAALSGALALEVFGDRWIALFSGLLTLAILIFSEIIPKTIGATFWKQLARPAAYVLRGMVVGMKPIIVPLSWFGRTIAGERPTTVTRGELEILAEMGRRQGTIDQDEWKVVSNVMRLDEVTVGEVMTPRTDVVGIGLDATVAEAKDLMLDEGHLRLPVYEESLDSIAGILLARDLWHADREGVREIREIMRPAQFAPSSKAVEELIPEMRHHRNKMAVVVDEFGGTAGIVTLEDLIEEIIGEIQDEHEHDEPVSFQRVGTGSVRIWGGVPLREVNEELGLDLPDTGHDTVGGYVFGALNRVGRVGDAVEVEGGIFRVARMRGRRIEYLLFTRATGRPSERPA